MGNELFLDTGFGIALTAPADQLHARALAASRELKTSTASLVTTRAVLCEIGNGLSKRRYRREAGELLTALECDPRVTIVDLSFELYSDALTLYVGRPDQEWGLVDCVSFVVMQKRNITDALTADHHFEQAGFRALLR